MPCSLGGHGNQFGTDSFLIPRMKHEVGIPRYEDRDKPIQKSIPSLSIWSWWWDTWAVSDIWLGSCYLQLTFQMLSNCCQLHQWVTSNSCESNIIQQSETKPRRSQDEAWTPNLIRGPMGKFQSGYASSTQAWNCITQELLINVIHSAMHINPIQGTRRYSKDIWWIMN